MPSAALGYQAADDRAHDVNAWFARPEGDRRVFSGHDGLLEV